MLWKRKKKKLAVAGDRITFPRLSSPKPKSLYRPRYPDFTRSSIYRVKRNSRIGSPLLKDVENVTQHMYVLRRLVFEVQFTVK
jgi:hypothetical protein